MAHAKAADEEVDVAGADSTSCSAPSIMGAGSSIGRCAYSLP
jgi:hypothetical protein